MSTVASATRPQGWPRPFSGTSSAPTGDTINPRRFNIPDTTRPQAADSRLEGLNLGPIGHTGRPGHGFSNLGDGVRRGRPLRRWQAPERAAVAGQRGEVDREAFGLDPEQASGVAAAGDQPLPGVAVGEAGGLGAVVEQQRVDPREGRHRKRTEARNTNTHAEEQP